MTYKISVLIGITLLMVTIGVASQGQSADAAAVRKQWLTSGNASTDASAHFLGTTDNQDLVFKTNGNEVMRLGTNGNLTMEDDNLTLKLITISDGNDQSRFEGRRARGMPGAPTIVGENDTVVIFRGRGWDGDSYRQLGDIRIRVDGAPGDDDMPGRIEFRTTPDRDDSSQRRMVIKNTGNVGIGTPNPQQLLHVNGNVLADAHLVPSSRRWKTNINPIEEALDKIQRLLGVSYNRKADGKRDIGLIAEDVAEVIPEVVAYEENGQDAQSIDYSRLVAVLIEALKEQQVEIDQLKYRVSELESIK